MAERVQLRRVKGWRLPEGARSVARPTKYGNPWRVGEIVDGELRTPEVVVGWYRDVLWRRDDDKRHGLPTLTEVRAELVGRDLACWCRVDTPCHADVLLEAANSATCSRCGDCCDPVTLSIYNYQGLTDPDDDVLVSPTAAANRAFVRAHWTPLARSDDQITLRCDAFDPATRTCTAYETRPPICSDFPHYGRPPKHCDNLPERCSFRADGGQPVALTRKPHL